MATPSTRRLPSLTKYEVLSELGHGGMATVYRAHDARLDRDVAVKVLHPHLRQSTEVGHRFSTEARAVAKLKHPNILEVYDVSDPDEYEQYLVVELVNGATLRSILSSSGPWPPEVAALLALELLQALTHAHAQGVVHRDVKPENVMVQCTPKTEGAKSSRTAVKLMDFGIAKLLDTKGVTSTGQVLGSPAHMAPEQIEGGEVDERADVFGIGVLLYECIVGHLPFQGANPAQVLRRVLEGEYPRADHELQTVGRTWGGILDEALALDRSVRFPTAEAFHAAIVRELKRVDFAVDTGVIADFLHDPDAFRALHAERMKTKLVALGTEARSRREFMKAANDLNRAVAYAPNDLELCKLAASVSRPKRRFPMWPAFAALGAVVGAGAFFATKRPPKPAVPEVVPPRVEQTLTSAPSLMTTATAAPSITVKPLVTAFAPRSTQPHPPRTARAARIGSVKIGSIVPQLDIVLVTVDGENPRAVSVGTSIPLDEQAHDLQFGCKGELCLRQVRSIPAGDQAVELAIQLEFKPATVVIDGDLSHKYQIEEYPALGVLRGAIPVRVALRRNDEPITITELETGAKKTGLLRAGSELRISFTQ